MSESENLKSLLRPIVKYVNEEVEQLKKTFPTDAKGDLGPQGERGLKGDPGDPGGPPGSIGEKGDVGAQGERGEQGFLGEQGYIGEKGDVGAQGERGKQGFLGEQGPLGEQGIQGVCGFTGDPGQSGDQGLKGKKGDLGEIGPRGLLGEQGIQGELGDRGSRGQRGQKGDLGEQGIPGIIGSRGDKGDKGEQGEIGPKGDLGEQGIPGDDGSVTQIEKEFDSFKIDIAKQVQQARRASRSGPHHSGGGAVNIMDQDDVKRVTPAEGQVLKWDSSEGKFVLADESFSFYTILTIGTKLANLETANAIQEIQIGNLTAQTASLVTANTIQNVELGNLTAQTATFNSTSTVNLWGKSQGTTPESITISGSAHTIDLRESNLFYITLENNVTVTLSNISDVIGCAFTFIVTQDATGSRLWTWHASTTPKFPGGFATALSTTALASDIISLVVANSTFVYSTSGLNYK